MAYNGFLTLVCRIESLGNHRFRATTRGEQRGRHIVDFDLPFTPEEQEKWLEQLREPFMLAQPSQWRTLEWFGTRLFNAVFRGENLATWRVLHQEARQNNMLLRLVIDLDAQELKPLPWEALFDSNERNFLTRDPHICIIRHSRSPAQPVPLDPRLPLRILALISAPEGVPSLDVEGEMQLLQEALQELIDRRQVELTWVDGRKEAATLDRLATQINRAAQAGTPYDVFHYIGHAGWSDRHEEGMLLLESQANQPVPTTGPSLGDSLRRGGLRLALLNACEGSRVDEAEPFRSVAATLLNGADLPAVIANQIEVSDRAAKSFAAAFYSALAKRLSVEEAIVAARQAVALSFTGSPEWVASVIYSRYENQPIRLLPPLPEARQGNPYIVAAILYLLATLTGITVVSFFRAYGFVVGTAVQLVFWALAVWFAYDTRHLVRRFRLHVGTSLLLAILTITTWFIPYQPALHVAIPPPDFALSLERPSPLAFRDDQITRVVFSITVTGQVFRVPEDHYIWILVQAENSATYVAGAPAEVQEDGSFVAHEVIVGPPVVRAVNHKRYTVQPVLVDAEGHRFLKQHSSPFWRFFHPDLRVVPQPRLQNALVIRK